MIGETVSHYRILELIGGGGMGVVYKAEDLRLGRAVALKFLPNLLQSEEQERRFILEAKTASSLDHPNICTIYEIDKLPDGRMFIAMAYYQGETLRKKLEAGPLTLERALDIGIQVSQGLSKAHEHGIVHRDIKPANIMITPDQDRIKILDFGLVKVAGDAGMTQSGVAVGTIAYMSPEQARGSFIDYRTDIWSTGVILYEMITGRLPFSGASQIDLLHDVIHGEPPPISSIRTEVPQILENILQRCLAKRPEHRYSSTLQMLQHMQEASGLSLPTRTISILSDSDHPARSVPLGAPERRSVTSIVSLLSGYTEMLENMIPAALESFLRQLREIAERTATKHGGILNQYSANQITVLFGLPVTHEDDYIRAIRFTIDLHQEVRNLGSSIYGKVGRQVRAQSGINTGLIIAEPVNRQDCKYQVSGLTVNVAARLAEEAEEDEILVSLECKRLIEPFFEIEPGSVLTFKGKQEITTYRIIRESGLQTLFEAAEKAGFTPYTGKDKELDVLRQAAQTVLEGSGRLVTISGEVGIGKSRLLYEFRNALDSKSLRFIQGRCQSFGNQVSYMPFIEALRDLLQISATLPSPDLTLEIPARIQEISPALSDFVPVYLHLLGIVREGLSIPRHIQGEDLRLMIQEALIAIFMQSARRAPLVLLLEDWHWADEASGDVLRHMAEILASFPVLVVVSYRPEGNPTLNPSAEQISIYLGPVDSSSAAQIIRFALKAESVPQDLVSRLHERTGGNPFFLEELCNSLVEAGRIRLEDGKGIISEDLDKIRLPDTVEAVIRTRLDRLESQDREILKVASVIGREFSRPVLQKAMGEQALPPRQLETLKTMGLIQQVSVVPEPVYRFKHILTQQVAYESMLPHQRKVLHGVIGGILENLYSHQIDEYSELLSDHYRRAEEWNQAVKFGQRSAQKAQRLGRFRDAQEHLQSTLELLMNLPDDSARRDKQIEILLSQERLMEILGLRIQQQKVIDQLLSILDVSIDTAQICEVYGRQGDLFTITGRFGDAEKVLSKSLRLTEQLKDPVQTRKVLRSVGFLRWQEGMYPESVAINQQAIAISKERDEPQEIAADLANLGNVLRNEGKFDEALKILEEALRIYEQHPDYVKQATTNHMIGSVYREQGDFDRALAYISKGRNISIKHRLVITQNFNTNSIATIYWQQGKLKESLELHLEALELNRKIGYADGLSHSLRNVGEMLLACDREKEALPYFLEGAQVFAQLGNWDVEVAMRQHAASIQEHLNLYSDAEKSWERICYLRQSALDQAGEIQALEGLARIIRIQAVEPEKALLRYKRAAELAKAIEDQKKEAEILNSMGIVEWGRSQYDEALKHYQNALSIFREIGDPIHEGFMLNSIGITCLRLGRYDEAEENLTGAAELNHQNREYLLEGHTCAILGELWQKRNDWAKSKYFFERSLEIRRQINDRKGEGWMLYQLARVYSHLGETDQCRARTEEAITIADEFGDEKLKQACSTI